MNLSLILDSPVHWSKEGIKGLDQQMYFIVHLQNDKSTKKVSPQTFFLFVLEGVYANFISQLQQTAPQTNKEDEERSGRSYNQTFIKPVCLSVCWHTGTFCCRESKGNIEKYDILSGLRGCRDPSEEVSFREREPARFGFSDRPSRPANTLCASYFSVVLPSQQESATVVNAFPKKSLHFDKKVGTFKKT